MMGFGMGGFSAMFTIIPIMVTVIFAIVIGMFLYAAATGLSQWKKNNASPRLTVWAQVVSKRMEVTHHRSETGEHGHHHTSTWYHITFQVDSGDRMEFAVNGQEYGMLAEGDAGELSFQGTRYLGFERG